MPGKYRRRRFVRRGRKQGFLAKALPVAQKALKVAKFVAGVVNAEYKVYTTSSALTSTSWTGIVNTLFQPTQGVAANQRDGDSCKIKDVTMRMEFSRNAASGVNAEMARLIVFWDKMNQITTASQFLQNTGTYASLYSQKNEDNRYNTKVIYDGFFPINNNTFLQRTREFVWKINNHVHFEAGSTNIKTGALKYLIMTQSASNGPQFTHITRVSFVDN